MQKRFRLPFLRNHRNYRGADQRFAGLALDVLRIYLNWEADNYYWYGGGSLEDITEMTMFEFPEDKGRKIKIKKIKEVKTTKTQRGYTEYYVEGFPQKSDFEDFQRGIEKIYRRILA